VLVVESNISAMQRKPMPVRERTSLSVLITSSQVTQRGKTGDTGAISAPERSSSGSRDGIHRNGGVAVAGGFDDIDFLGPDPGRTLAMFVLFYWMGRIFAEGARSLREINRALESRSFIGKLPEGIPYGTASLSRCGTEVEEYFGRHFGFGGKAALFARRERGCAITGLTCLGVDAWALVHDFLVRFGVVGDEAENGWNDVPCSVTDVHCRA